MIGSCCTFSAPLAQICPKVAPLVDLVRSSAHFEDELDLPSGDRVVGGKGPDLAERAVYIAFARRFIHRKTRMREMRETVLMIDPAGRSVRVIKVRVFDTVRTFQGSQEIEKLGRYALADGSHVNQLSDEEFQVLATGVKLTLLK